MAAARPGHHQQGATMGIVANIRADSFPRQSEQLGKQVQVCFHYDISKIITGTVVRDDAETPWKTIIRLDDGRHVLTTECMWSPA